MPELHTTNVLLGIMAGVSVLEALLLIGLGAAGFVVYRRVMQLVTDLEARQVAPIREKVDAILMDVRSVTARVSQRADRVDQAIAGTIDHVDMTARRVRERVRDKVSQANGVVQGVRAAIMSVLGHRAAA